MASIAGTVLFLYASILGKVLPDAVAHLLIASIVSAPAALVISFLMVPPAADLAVPLIQLSQHQISDLQRKQREVEGTVIEPLRAENRRLLRLLRTIERHGIVESEDCPVCAYSAPEAPVIPIIKGSIVLPYPSFVASTACAMPPSCAWMRVCAKPAARHRAAYSSALRKRWTERTR